MDWTPHLLQIDFINTIDISNESLKLSSQPWFNFSVIFLTFTVITDSNKEVWLKYNRGFESRSVLVHYYRAQVWTVPAPRNSNQHKPSFLRFLCPRAGRVSCWISIQFEFALCLTHSGEDNRMKYRGVRLSPFFLWPTHPCHCHRPMLHLKIKHQSVAKESRDHFWVSFFGRVLTWMSGGHSSARKWDQKSPSWPMRSFRRDKQQATTSPVNRCDPRRTL